MIVSVTRLIVPRPGTPVVCAWCGCDTAGYGHDPHTGDCARDLLRLRATQAA